MPVNSWFSGYFNDYIHHDNEAGTISVAGHTYPDSGAGWNQLYNAYNPQQGWLNTQQHAADILTGGGGGPSVGLGAGGIVYANNPPVYAESNGWYTLQDAQELEQAQQEPTPMPNFSFDTLNSTLTKPKKATKANPSASPGSDKRQDLTLRIVTLIASINQELVEQESLEGEIATKLEAVAECRTQALEHMSTLRQVANQLGKEMGTGPLFYLDPSELGQAEAGLAPPQAVPTAAVGAQQAEPEPSEQDQV